MKHLFVYGSLLSGTQSQMAKFLLEGNEFVGETHLPGKLYDLGRYPGFIYDEKAPEMVYGHLFAILDPAHVFGVLDHFEGINHQEPIQSEYLRIQILHRFEGREIEVHFYHYNLSPEGLPLITSGDYREYWRDKPAHRRFISS